MWKYIKNKNTKYRIILEYTSKNKGMKYRIKVEYNVAFDNYKDIYTSNSLGIAVPEFSIARRTNDEESRLNFNKYSKGEFEFDYGENDTIDELVKELFRYLGFFYDSAFEYGAYNGIVI